MTLRDFENLLEVYGADRTRWPLAARAKAMARLASDGTAQRLMAEAEALDAVLLQGPEPAGAEVMALADRIIAATRATPRVVASGRPVVQPLAAPPVRKVVFDHSLWRAMALLAASLMIGIFAGQSQIGAGAVPAFEALTDTTFLASYERLALADIHLDQVEED